MPEVMGTLLEIESHLKHQSSGDEVDRLRMIINDHLADYYLRCENYGQARECSKTSFSLKLHTYSSYHPSLILNYQLMASCFRCEAHLQRDAQNYQKATDNYEKAVRNYENAIKIQLENMPSNHPDIRANYFRLGNCYCRMDKLEQATEFYEQATGSNDSEAEGEDGAGVDPQALLHMHLYLSDLHAKREDFSRASSHLQVKIDHLREILPAWIAKMMEKDGDLQMSCDELKKVIETRLSLWDRRRFRRVLENLVYARSSQARSLFELQQQSWYGKDATDIFEQAIELRLKLNASESLDEIDLAQTYMQLAQAYQQLYYECEDDVRRNLLKALEESVDDDQKRALEFRLGNLYYAEENYGEAARLWTSALMRMKENNSIIEHIVYDRIRYSTTRMFFPVTSSFSHNPSQHTKTVDEERSEQNPSRLRLYYRCDSVPESVHERYKLEDLAQACIDLGNDEMALKYLEEYIIKSEDLVKATRPEVEISRERSSLVRLYYDLMNKALQSAKYPNEQVWTEIKMCKKFYACAQRLGNDFESIRRGMLVVFRISEKENLLPKGLKSLFRHLFEKNLDDLEWGSVAKYHTDFDSMKVFLGVAEHEWSNRNFDKVLQIYFTLRRRNATDLNFFPMIDYGILKLFNVDIATVQDYCAAVEKVDIQSNTTPIFDRILLCRLIITFYDELGDEKKVNDYRKRLVELYREGWPSQPLKHIPGIGQQLIQFNLHNLALYYWQDLQNLYVEVMPAPLSDRLYVSDSTFAKLHCDAEEFSKALPHLLQSLAQSYASMADYELKCGWMNESCQSLETAIVIGKKMEPLKKAVEEWQKKLDEQKA